MVDDYGSVSISIYCGAYSSNSYENFKTSTDSKYSLFYQSSAYTANHAVTIVGYDDSFDKTIFYNAGYSEPAMDGAFIVKNSWGTSWGYNGGYFYMSYDSYLDTIYAFGDLVSRDTYDYEYDYTPYMPVGKSTSYYDETQSEEDRIYFGSYANYFEKQSSGSEKINKISVYVISPDTTLNLYIDTDASDEKFDSPTAVAATEIGDGSASYTVDGYDITVPYAGNYVFELAEPVEVDNDFTVIVYGESKNGAPVAYESTYDFISHKCTGNGYISSSVTGGTYTEQTSLDFMIRAYTEEVPVTVTVDGTGYTASYGDILSDVLSENSISDTVYETVSGEDNSYTPADTTAAVTDDITLYTSSYICAPTIEMNNYQTLTEDGNNIIRFVGEITDNLDDKVSTITALGFVYSTDGSETTTTTTDLYSSLESYTPEDGIYLFKLDELTAGDYTVSAYVKYKLTDSEDVITVYTSEQTITTSSE
ncbi:MAG: hypothetical protein LUD77_01355 [Clostridiales bacterium]|nr:hypothetical protein [Clostridiales bacterium]